MGERSFEETAPKHEKIINRNQKLISFRSWAAPTSVDRLLFLSETHREAAEEKEPKRRARRRESQINTRIPTSRFDSFKLFDALHIHFNG